MSKVRLQDAEFMQHVPTPADQLQHIICKNIVLTDECFNGDQQEEIHEYVNKTPLLYHGPFTHSHIQSSELIIIQPRGRQRADGSTEGEWWHRYHDALSSGVITHLHMHTRHSVENDHTSAVRLYLTLARMHLQPRLEADAQRCKI